MLDLFDTDKMQGTSLFFAKSAIFIKIEENSIKINALFSKKHQSNKCSEAKRNIGWLSTGYPHEKSVTKIGVKKYRDSKLSTKLI